MLLAGHFRPPSPHRSAAAFILGLLVICCGCGTSAPPVELATVPEDGIEALNEKYQEAIRAALKQLDWSDANKSGNGRKELAKRYLATGKLLCAHRLSKGAKACLANASRLVPDHEFEAKYVLGHVERVDEQYAAAIEAFQAAIDAMPDRGTRVRYLAQAHCWIADCHLQLKQYDQAQKHFQQTLAENPLINYARLGLGLVFVGQQKDQEALKPLQAALEANPLSVNLHEAIAGVHERLGNKAAADYHRSRVKPGGVEVEIDDTLWQEIQNLGNVASVHRRRGDKALFVDGQYLAAIDHYRRAIELEPENARLHHDLAAALVMTNQATEAVTHLRIAIRIDPTLAKAHSNLGVLYRAAKERDKALEHFALAHQHDPQDAKNLVDWGITLAQQDAAAGLEKYRQAVQVDPRNEDALLQIAIALAKQKKFADAISQLESARNALPSSQRFTLMLVHLLAACPDDSVRNGPKALKVIQQADPKQQPVAHAQAFAMVYAELGDFAQALVWQEKAIKAAENTEIDLKELNATLAELKQKKPIRLIKGQPWSDKESK